MVGRIASDRWPARSTLPPVRLLAGDLNVSLTTVVKALRRLARRGLVTVRRRQGTVLAEGAAERARNLLARRRTRRRPPCIGILVPEGFFPLAGNPAYNSLVDEIIIAARRQSFATELVAWPAKHPGPFAASVARRGFAAVTCVGFYIGNVLSFHLLCEAGLRVTAFNRYIETPPIPSVHVDDYGAGREIAHRLAELGHRNMCLVSHQSAYGREINGRVSGWIDYLVEHDLVRDCTLPLYIIPCAGHLPEYWPAFADVLRSPNRPTALVFAHSPWAAAFLTDPRFKDLAVPDEISLVTFENLPEGVRRTMRSEMTTIQMDYRRTGECLVEQIVRILAGDQRPPNIRVPMYFMMTDSVGRPPGGGSPRR